MLIGFKIASKPPDEKAAIDFVKKVAMMHDDVVAVNLVRGWDKYNIYVNKGVTAEDLISAPFSYSVINRTPNITLINKTDSRVEIPYVISGEARFIILEATGYVDITKEIHQQILKYIGVYVRTIPEMPNYEGYGDFSHNDFSSNDFL